MDQPTTQSGVNVPAAGRPDRWEPLSPPRVRELLAGYDRPWWIAGGWALDLFVGRETRAHEDVEIAVYRPDVEALRARLREWEIVIASGGDLLPWDRGPLPTEAHTLWLRERGREAWQLEVLVEERDERRWRYRRHALIGLDARDLGRLTPDGLPYLRPEIVLLYKSKDPRPKDESDFLTVLPRLDPAQRAFLAAGLWATAPGHRWLGRLR